MDIAFTRLEAVTSRLEDLAACLTNGPGIAAQPAAPPAPTTTSAVPSSQPAPAHPAAVEIDELPHVASYQQIINEKVQPALKLLSSISEGVEAMQEQVRSVRVLLCCMIPASTSVNGSDLLFFM